MKTAVILAGAAAVALITAGLASATQSGPPEKSAAPANLSGVTVTPEAKPNPLVDKTTEFVRQRLPTDRNEQYARFRDPICVKVVGLPEEFDTFIAKRVMEMAAKVHAPADPSAACKPNVNVIFSNQPQVQLSDIAKKRDLLFGYYLKADFKRLTTFSRPIQAWYLTRTVGTNGDGRLEINTGPDCISSHAPNSPPCDIKAPVIGKAGSRLGSDISSELVHSLIIADERKVSGQPIGVVADYIAVLALSRWQGLEKCSGLPTILNLMADGCEAQDQPEAVTPGDLALLTGLYSVDPRESGQMQRASIAGAARKANALAH